MELINKNVKFEHLSNEIKFILSTKKFSKIFVDVEPVENSGEEKLFHIMGYKKEC